MAEVKGNGPGICPRCKISDSGGINVRLTIGEPQSVHGRTVQPSSIRLTGICITCLRAITRSMTQRTAGE